MVSNSLSSTRHVIHSPAICKPPPPKPPPPPPPFPPVIIYHKLRLTKPFPPTDLTFNFPCTLVPISGLHTGSQTLGAWKMESAFKLDATTHSLLWGTGTLKYSGTTVGTIAWSSIAIPMTTPWLIEIPYSGNSTGFTIVTRLLSDVPIP